jgi:ArsR family transcriptional regulator
MTTIDSLLIGLRAAAEPTRLRLLALCAEGELTVSELTQIMGQSQPRVSRHLKLLCEAGLLERYQERSWVFYRLARRANGDDLARTLSGLLPTHDPTLALDRERLAAVKRARTERAAHYFRDNARRWNQIRRLYVPESEVERALLAQFADVELHDLLDVGTGTGRIIEIMAPHIKHGVGVDLSHEMLEVARVKLESATLRHCQVRHGDMYNLPFASASFDAVIFHMVLHFADNPVAALAEAARVLRPGGKLVVVDFAPHDQEFLREAHAHRRLGFAEAEVEAWFAAVGLVADRPERLLGQPLTVLLWPARRSNVETIADGRRRRGGQA